MLFARLLEFLLSLSLFLSLSLSLVYVAQTFQQYQRSGISTLMLFLTYAFIFQVEHQIKTFKTMIHTAVHLTVKLKIYIKHTIKVAITLVVFQVLLAQNYRMAFEHLECSVFCGVLCYRGVFMLLYFNRLGARFTKQGKLARERLPWCSRETKQKHAYFKHYKGSKENIFFFMFVTFGFDIA